MSFLTDDGITGGSIEKRPAIREAMRMLKDGEADSLIVAKLDRLSRSILDFAHISDESRKGGWRLIILDPNVDSGTHMGKMMLGILAVFAEFERDCIRSRTKEALRIKKAQGVILGRRPDENEPIAVARVREIRSEGVSWQEVAKRLNDEGTPTTSGRGKWDMKTAQRLFKRWECNMPSCEVISEVQHEK